MSHQKIDGNQFWPFPGGPFWEKLEKSQYNWLFHIFSKRATWKWSKCIPINLLVLHRKLGSDSNMSWKFISENWTQSTLNNTAMYCTVSTLFVFSLECTVHHISHCTLFKTVRCTVNIIVQRLQSSWPIFFLRNTTPPKSSTMHYVFNTAQF